MSARDEASKPRTPNGQWKHKLTEEIIEKACQATRLGVHPRFIAARCGVDEATFYRWIQRGNDGGRPLERKLAAELEIATSDYVVNSHAKLYQDSTPRDIIEMLGRRFPNEYGRKDHLVTEQTVEHKMTLNLPALSTEALELIARADRLVLEAADVVDGEVIELPDQ